MSAIMCTIEGVRTRSSTQECLLTLSLPIEHATLLARFLGLVGTQIGVAFAVPGEKVEPDHIADTGKAIEPPKIDGHWVSALYKSGWWFNPKVLAALGTDKQYREWIQRQPSAYDGQFSEYVDGEGRCIAAHVRRAGESGTAYKAPYACIPLTDAEHQLQHGEGESAFPGGAEWFDKQRAEYVQKWAHERLREALGVESLTMASAANLRGWAFKHDLLNTLPLAVRE